MENKDNNIVMLPTEKESILYIDDDGKLNISSNSELPDGINSNQHLYILSDDEIKEGDWCIETLNKVKFQVIGSGNNYNNSTFKKIIATTDNSIACIQDVLSIPQRKGLTNHYPTEKWVLPQPSQSFIEKYVEEYNKGNKNMKTTDGVHLSHCNQGEYEGSCKYGDESCPAMVDPAQDRINGLIKQKDLHKYHEIVEKIKKDLIVGGFDEDDIYEYLEYNLYRLIHND